MNGKTDGQKGENRWNQNKEVERKNRKSVKIGLAHNFNFISIH